MAKLEQISPDIRILVVDDYALTRAMVQSILKGVGFHNLVQADNGVTAVRKLEEEDELIDLIICDWRMPGMTGVDFLRHVRGTERYREVPFLMLTAEATRAAVQEAIDAGVSDYVSKPFTADVLLEKISGLMAHRKRE